MVTEVTFSPVTQEDRGVIECVGYDLKGQSVGTVGSLNLKKVLGKSKSDPDLHQNSYHGM